MTHEIGAFDELRAELGIDATFTPRAEAEAERARIDPTLRRVDRRDIELVTIDPPGSRDLDQAIFTRALPAGFEVVYAIADVGGLVRRGGALDREAWKRGVTIYAPDRRTPLYPPTLSEGTGSLLPGVDRGAILFTHELGADGTLVSTKIERALVRSRRQMTYAEAQREGVGALEPIGRKRMEIARARGAIRIDVPPQIAVADAGAPGGYRLEVEDRLPVEDWNAEISLMTGMAAAALMIEHGVGLLRITEEVDVFALSAARAAAPLLGVDWAADERVADLVSRLRCTSPKEAALLALVRRAMGKARYAVIGGGEGDRHVGLAAHYTHCTAPLRRLADRYVLDLVLDLAAGVRSAPWRTAPLVRLPEAMAAADARSGKVDRAVIDQIEVMLLAGRIGERFTAIVTAANARDAEIQLVDPPIRARMRAWPGVQAGQTVTVRAGGADEVRRRVAFTIVD